jgi:CheY-like chemotaxis protein
VTEKPTVLVVDDDELMRWLMEEALGGSFRVVLAESGEAALALARTACPKAVVLDVDLPGISGFETCRQLKASDATAQVPVVFVSGSESAEDPQPGACRWWRGSSGEAGAAGNPAGETGADDEALRLSGAGPVTPGGMTEAYLRNGSQAKFFAAKSQFARLLRKASTNFGRRLR